MGLVDSLKRVAKKIGISHGRDDKLEITLANFLCEVITQTARAYYPLMRDKPAQEGKIVFQEGLGRTASPSEGVAYTIPFERIKFYEFFSKKYEWQCEMIHNFCAEFKFGENIGASGSQLRTEIDNLRLIDKRFFDGFTLKINQTITSNSLIPGSYSILSNGKSVLELNVGWLELAKTEKEFETRLDYIRKIIIHECNHIEIQKSERFSGFNFENYLLYFTSDAELRAHCAEFAKKYFDAYSGQTFKYSLFQEMMRKHSADDRFRPNFFIIECLMGSDSSKKSLDFTSSRNKYLKLFNEIHTLRGFLLADGTYMDSKRAKKIAQKILNFLTYYVEVFNKRA